MAVTCQHALVDNAGSTNQHCITGHDGPVAGNDHDITRYQVCGHRFFNLCVSTDKRGRDRNREKGVKERESMCISTPDWLSSSLIYHAPVHSRQNADSSWQRPLRQMPFRQVIQPCSTALRAPDTHTHIHTKYNRFLLFYCTDLIYTMV